MSNSIGIIFHKDWDDFSPMLYSHYGADCIPWQLQDYMREYYKEYDINNEDNIQEGHLYEPRHMLVGFLQSIDKDIHDRVSNLNIDTINTLVKTHEFDNCLDGGIWLINVSINHFGNTLGYKGKYYLKDGNILTEDLKNKENDLYEW